MKCYETKCITIEVSSQWLYRSDLSISGILFWPVNTMRVTPTGRPATPLTGTPRMWGLPGTLWVSCLYCCWVRLKDNQCCWVRLEDYQCCWVRIEDNRFFGSHLWTMNQCCWELNLRTASKCCWVTLEDYQCCWARLEDNQCCWVRLEDNQCFESDLRTINVLGQTWG